MNTVLISSASRYPINRPQIKKTVLQFLDDSSLEEAEISVAFVGRRKIRQLNKDWRKFDEETVVLTFSLEEPRDKEGILRIGDIVISYPEAQEIAIEENLTMNQAIDQLLVHGLKNLLKKSNNGVENGIIHG